MKNNDKKYRQETPADNEQFAKIAAVSPLKILRDYAILYPAVALVKCRHCCKAAALLGASGGQRSGNLQDIKKLEINDTTQY
jgi:hypothetical protein